MNKDQIKTAKLKINAEVDEARKKAGVDILSRRCNGVYASLTNHFGADKPDIRAVECPYKYTSDLCNNCDHLVSFSMKGKDAGIVYCLPDEDLTPNPAYYKSKGKEVPPSKITEERKKLLEKQKKESELLAKRVKAATEKERYHKSKEENKSSDKSNIPFNELNKTEQAKVIKEFWNMIREERKQEAIAAGKEPPKRFVRRREDIIRAIELGYMTPIDLKSFDESYPYRKDRYKQ